MQSPDVMVTAEAKPYAAIWLNQPGYSCAQTLATDQAIAECSEGKEVPPGEEVAVSISLVGPLSLRDFLECVRYSRGVDRGLASEQSRFREVIVMLDLAEKKRCAAEPNE